MKKTFPLYAAMLLLCLSCSLRGAALYVSTAGNDSWSGTLPEPNKNRTDGPFATPGKARDAVRALKRSDGLPRGGVTVYFREGAYPLSETFRLTSEDSGTEKAPIAWRAYREEKVQFAGGKEIDGFEPATDPGLIGRLD
ncbi:MAG: hypothetical protein ACYC9O_18640, partial [Candidatus Latescibacterota bacterium]